jgi:hypothetical protein
MDDLEGWQQTRWGMTTGEIIEAVGKENLRRVEETRSFNEFYADLTIPNVAIGQYEFDVVFQMGNETDRLEQVLISYEEDPDRSPTSAFKAALKLLTEKFGSPERIGTSDEFQWRFPTTTIEASTMFVEGVASSVHIRFFPSEESASRTQIAAF